MLSPITHQMMRERLRWGIVLRCVAENTLVALLLVVPRYFCVNWVKRRIAQHVYDCEASDIYLCKSGRSALRGIMAALRAVSPDRRVAYVPDYVCNVVGEACRAAGFTTMEYPTDQRCLPKWEVLGDLVHKDAAPVVVLCSLFGSVPAKTQEAEALIQSNPLVFIVADECQNLVPHSQVRARINQAVVFSFNDKTCPGIMGGGVVCETNSGLTPVIANGTSFRRILCSAALFRQWLLKIGREARHIIRLARTGRRSPAYGVPSHLDVSTCLRPHFDLVAEPIFKLSAIRAFISLLFLDSYRRSRIENAVALQMGLKDLQVGFGDSSIKAAPPFLPVMPRMSPLPDEFPAPVKPAYGRSDTSAIAYRDHVVLKINTPYLRYESRVPVVVQLTSRHAITDNRILHCMARTSVSAGCQSIVMGPALESGSINKVQLQACPLLDKGRRHSHAWLLIQVLRGALKSRHLLFQIHDPDLLPVGLILKVFGRRVIYDVHDDYEASFRDRLRNRGWLGRLVPPLWWWFERHAASVFDGVVVADRHLAKKFARCNPVILGNYPRLDFTAAAQAANEETFNLIYVGGVTRERGLEMLLKSLRLIPLPSLRLHIIGTSRDTDLLDMLRADPRVVLHGRVVWTELHRYYERAHIGIALYQPLDSFFYYPGENAVKVIEYMAAGIPVVCSDFPGLRTFVKDSGCGIVVKPDDPEAIAKAIRQLIDDPCLRSRMGAQGRLLFESEYNWEKHEHKLTDLYRKALK